MAGLNKVMLIGNVGADPDVRNLPSGDKVTTLRIATTETYKNKNGERMDETEWHRVEFWGGLAGIVEQYVRKGHSIYVEGKIKYEKYTDSSNVERFSTKIRANQMQMLSRAQSRQDEASELGDSDDILPF